MSARTQLLTLSALLLAASSGRAVPTVWDTGPGANGHAYEFAQVGAITWQDAKADAESRTYSGVPGHLATITSVEESDFVSQIVNIPFLPEAWLGAYQPDPSSPPDQGWVWITGEPWTFTNWDSDEPNDNLGDEHYLGIWGQNGFGPLGAWNDQEEVQFLQNITGYVVEYPLASVGVRATVQSSTWSAVKALYR